MDYFGEELEERQHPGLMVARTIVCCVGLVGNLLVIFVITALKEYEKTITHWYVLQLALADCSFLLTLPFRIAEDAYDEWAFSGTMCKLKEAMLFINYYSSILFLMVMSVDRYIAVCRNFDSKLQTLRKKSSAYAITVIIWIVAILLSIPVMINSNKRGIDPNCKCMYDFSEQTSGERRCNESDLDEGQSLKDCISYYENKDLCVKLDDEILSALNDMDYDYSGSETEGYAYSSGDNESGFEMGCSYGMIGKGWTAYIMFNFIAMFVVPFLLMSFCYTAIALRLRNARVRGATISNEVRTASGSESAPLERNHSMSVASRKAEKKRIRATILCFILVVLFLVCWLPFHSVHLAKFRGITASTESCAKMASITTVIAYMNSALNPYVYNFIGNRFSKRLKSALRKIASACWSGFESPNYHSTSTANGQTLTLKLIGRHTIAKVEGEEDKELNEPT